jgi:hypothetical protein
MTASYWPAVFYGPHGQSGVFENPLEVPEGWHDTFHKFGEDGEALPDATTEIPGLEEALAGADTSEDEGDEEEEGDEDEAAIPAIDDITVAEIKALLDDKKIEYQSGANKAELYTLLTSE